MPGPVVRSEELTPFVSELEAGLREGVDSALRQFLGLPAAMPLSWYAARPEPGEGVVVKLAVEPAPSRTLRLHVHDAHYAGPRWRTGPDFRLSYSAPSDCRDPFRDADFAPLLRRLDRRFGHGFEAAKPPSLDPVVRALQAYWRHVGVRDAMYRQVSSAQTGAYGTLRVGFRCNQDCHFCWQARDWPDPPHDLCVRWIDEMAAGGVERIVFSGGEPTIYRTLPELVRHAAKVRGLDVGLETNAIQLRRRPLLERLLAAGLTRALVSFHAADEASSDRVTRAPGTWRATVEGIEAALSAGLLVSLNCVVERGNAAGLGDHARFIADRFVRAHPEGRILQVIYSHPCSYHDEALWERSLVPLDVLRPRILEAARTLMAAGVHVNASGSCGFPPCVVADEPSLVASLPTDGLDTADTSGRVHVAACEGCAARGLCLGVRREYVAHLGDRGIVPIPVLSDAFRRAQAESVLVLPA